jgi:hypothetical protein
MRTTIKGQTGHNKDIAQEQIDKGELWMDTDITSESLIELDPLDIDSQIVERAESPELDDFSLQSLPERRFSLRQEAMENRVLAGKVAQARMQGWIPERIQGS